MMKILLLPIALVFGLISAPMSAQACACCGTWKVKNVAANDQLNIRSGPGVRYRVVGGVPSGSACVIKTGQCQGNWCKINFAQYDGWVNTRYLGWLQ